MSLHHKSMSFDGGSQVFCVGQKLFQVPKALLAMHSEVFRGMVELPESETAPIELQDSEEHFAAFSDAIMMPLESCLFKKDPELLEVLGVLVLANKYCATTIEGHARSLAIQLADPKTIKAHLNAQFSSLRAIELAQTARCSEIASAAWDVAMQEFRKRRRAIHEMLCFADRLGDPQYVGEAYYEAMLRGHRVWNSDPHLTPTQKQRLGAGTAICVETLNEIVSLWKRAPRHFDTSHRCTHAASTNSTEAQCGYKFSAPWLEECVERGLSHCDLLGRLEIATKVKRPPYYRTFDSQIVRGRENENLSSSRMPDCHECSARRATELLVSCRRPVSLAALFSIGEAASSM